MEYKIVKIDWIDSCIGPAGWGEKEDYENVTIVKCTTVGFVVQETKEHITIANTVNEDQLLGVVTIPKCCIKKKKQLT